MLDRNDVPHKLASVGVPPACWEMRLFDDEGREVPPGQVGEICGRGPILMAGYYKRPDLTAKAIVDGWLHSGDLGYVDDDGYLYLVDRKKDMIISGGVNVYPRDIEEVIVQHPAVREVAVFGVADARWGETPIAAVVLRDVGAATTRELVAWINARVGAKVQRVSDVIILDDFSAQRRRQDPQARADRRVHHPAGGSAPLAIAFSRERSWKIWSTSPLT